MDDVIARCPDCGTEQVEAFANCFVCLAPSRWWCRSCRDWRPARGCPACGGGVGVPAEAFLGAGIVGATVPFAVTVRNPGTKLINCTASSPDAGVAITTPRLLVPPGGSCEARGGIAVGPGAHGPRAFRLRFGGPVPTETRLVVEVVAPVTRLQFFPDVVSVGALRPGGTARASVVLKNTGTVPLGARLACSEPWLSASAARVDLAPGEATTVRLGAKSKRTDFGPREAKLVATADGGTWEVTVRHALPDPQLAADPVAFGELIPGHPVFADVVVRNTGRVRVGCVLAATDPWLQVRPARLNLPPGREKTVRARALITGALEGPQRCELVASSAAGVVLRVPVTATGRVLKAALRPVRKQRVRDALGPPVERKFQVANDGDGRLVCTATADRPWVRIITPALKVGPGKKRNLRYVLDLPALSRGLHSATIALRSNGGSAEVPITVQVLDPNPVLEVVRGPDLGPVSPDLPLVAFVQVRNGGIGPLTVRARTEDPRVTVAPEAAEVHPGPPVRFNLTIPLVGLPGGGHEVGVRFVSNGGSDRAVVRFRLPVEQIEAPAVIDLGDRPAGRSTGGALQVRNSGPDRVTLEVKGEHQWVRPGCTRLTLEPGETIAVPFRVDLAPRARGPVGSAILLAGRTVRHAVAVRAVARKVALVVVPRVVELGNLSPGAERTFTVEVFNKGEVPVELRELHAPGELEVWVRHATVYPGDRITLGCRAVVNARRTGKTVRAVVALTDGAAVRCAAQVVPPTAPRVLAIAAAAGGLIVGVSLTATVGWWLGAPVALVGLATGAWLLWRGTELP